MMYVLALLGAVTLTPTEQAMVDNVNAARQAAGLPALKVETIIQEGTRKHASWMAARRSMTHASGWCENIATGQRSCWSVHTTWMNSGGHRANILRRGVTTLGVAAYQVGNGTIYWCMRVR